MQYPQNITKPVKRIEMTIKYRNLFLCNVNSHKELKKMEHSLQGEVTFYYRTVRSNKKKKQSSTAKGKRQLLLHLKR